MIFDHLQNLKRYFIPQSDKILDFISRNNLSDLPNGQIDIDGKNLFVRVMEYVPKPFQDNKFETHQIYADLQYIVSGFELMQYVDGKYLNLLTEYDSTGDYKFFEASERITNIVVEQGQFVAFYPFEAHRPACLYQDKIVTVKKLVFKIKIN